MLKAGPSDKLKAGFSARELPGRGDAKSPKSRRPTRTRARGQAGQRRMRGGAVRRGKRRGHAAEPITPNPNRKVAMIAVDVKRGTVDSQGADSRARERRGERLSDWWLAPPKRKSCPAGIDLGILDTRAQPGEQFVIPPGQFAYLLTEEVVRIPSSAMGFISLKFGVKGPGLINVSGFHVDPGYWGRLVFSVYNAGPSEARLQALGLCDARD